MPQRSHGTLLLVGDNGTPETFTPIAELKDFDWDGFERAVHDASSHTSQMSTPVGGLLKQGEFKFAFNYLPEDPTQDSTTGLYALLVSGETRNFQLTYPSPSTTKVQVTGFVSSVSVKAPVDGILGGEATIVLNNPSGPAWSQV